MKKTMLVGALVAAMVVAAACGKEAQPALRDRPERMDHAGDGDDDAQELVG